MNAFGVDDPRISKGLPSYLRAAANSRKGEMNGTKAFDALASHKAKKWSQLPGQFTADSKIGTKNPQGAYQVSRLISHDRGQLAAAKIAGGGKGKKDIKRGQEMRDASRTHLAKNVFGVADHRDEVAKAFFGAKGARQGLEMVANTRVTRNFKGMAPTKRIGPEAMKRANKKTMGDGLGGRVKNSLSGYSLSRMKDDPLS